MIVNMKEIYDKRILENGIMSIDCGNTRKKQNVFCIILSNISCIKKGLS